jgi:hypothetical protein
MTISGAIGNGARFFERYYRKLLSIDKLTFFASHIVLTAGRIDPVMIDDLDVALFDNAGFHLLDENQKTPFRRRSDELDGSIRNRLFAESP